MRRFEDKVVIVAGGATGIGSASAQRLAREGASVVVGDLNIEGAKATVESILEAGGTATAVEFDLADEASVVGLVQATVDTYGRVNLLHANGAALHLTAIDTDVVDVDLGVWEQSFRVNLFGYFYCLRHTIPRLLEQGGGAIVCTSSSAAVRALPNMPGYMASKAGVEALIRHVSARWADEGIRCNGISPAGLTRSPSMEKYTRPEYLKAARSIGEPTDMAGAIAYLLSDEARRVNGQIVYA
jgi:NAD(P)-dependent dehydrogenase (short-subunit alcohol dehydrogenase family)